MQQYFAKLDKRIFAEHLQELIKGSSKYSIIKQECLITYAKTILNPK
jgi:hypothetical protein